MKRMCKILLFVPILLILFSISANAQTIDDFDDQLRELKSQLSDDVIEDLSAIGIDDYRAASEAISFSSVMKLLSDKLRENLSAPVTLLISVMSVILVTSVCESYRDSLSRTPMREVMGTVSAAAVVSLLSMSLLPLVTAVSSVTAAAARLMTLYIPVMIAILSFSGRMISSAGYYSAMMTASSAVSALSDRVIAPLMSFYLALSISSVLTDRVKLRGICEMITKFVKWALLFVMTLFTGVLSLKAVSAGAYDSVVSRGVRYSLSSFIPIVGASLSEAYRAISSSVGVLRSGVGVFVIMALAVSFLPVMVRVVLMMLSVNLCKAAAETLSADTVRELLSAVSSALTVLFAVLISVLSVFVVSTAMMIGAGGAP